jgi:hypothetical protein
LSIDFLLVLLFPGVPRLVPVIFAGSCSRNAERTLLPGQTLIKYSFPFRCHNNPIVAQVDSIFLVVAREMRNMAQ